MYRKSQVVEPDHRLTRREMQDILNGYRMIFDMVHLLDGDALNLSRQQAEGEDMGDGCRADLGDPDQAMRCLALQALESRGEEAMVISDKGTCYELIAKYLEVDGEPPYFGIAPPHKDKIKKLPGAGGRFRVFVSFRLRKALYNCVYHVSVCPFGIAKQREHGERSE